jgi:hypothetical protein
VEGTLTPTEEEEVQMAVERARDAFAEVRLEEYRVCVLRLQRAARLLEQASRRH